MKNLIVILVIFFSLSKHILAQTKDNTGVNWISFDQLSDSLKTNPKEVLIFFHTDWCSYCKKMMKETFKNSEIIQRINTKYYAVHFDAESIDTLTFDGTKLRNAGIKKKRGQYHQIATLLIPQNNVAFPTTLLLDKEFRPKKIYQKYLSIKEFVKIL